MKMAALVVIFSITMNAEAQTSPERIPAPRNAIRFNLVPPLVSATAEFSYERLIKPQLSVVAGVGGNWKGNKSDFIISPNADLSFLNRDIRNRYFILQVRRFINFCECNPPSGFYVGGFARYNDLDISSDVRFGNNISSLDVNLNLNITSMNFGALLGYQISRNNWVVDFDFGGVGYAPNWVEFNSSSTLGVNELGLISDAISSNFGFAGNYKDVELNSSNVTFDFWAWTIRYGASIGYRF